MSTPKKDVHRHLIRTLGEQIPAHVPWRRMHGRDANGFRLELAHSNNHVVLLVTGACKLRFKSASQQFGHHEMLPREFRGVGIPSSPPFLFLRSRSLRGPPNGYAILSPSDRAIWRSKADGLLLRWSCLRRGRPFAGAARPAVADGDHCAALAAVASRVFRLPLQARRRSQWPPVLRPPAAPAPPIG